MNEFECHCGCRMPDSARANIVALVEQVLDPARERYGKPVCVNSGYRCARHNAAVGGVANSQHMRGEAADICCCDNKRLAEIIEANGRYDQLILYPTFVHVSWKKAGGNRKQILRKTAKGYEKIDAVNI
ncbi:MAG: peptidase M15 [Bacteroidaceae bacterium]|nr:peptidase M15 [Bacteroidaceae bacterium]